MVFPHVLMPMTICSLQCCKKMFSQCSWMIPGMNPPSTLEHICGFPLFLGLKIVSWSYKAVEGWFLATSSAKRCLIFLPALCTSHTALFPVSSLHVPFFAQKQFFNTKLSQMLFPMLDCYYATYTHKQHCVVNSYFSLRLSV